MTQTFNITAPKAVHASLTAWLVWYEQMPNDKAVSCGERFHENLRDALDEAIGGVPEDWYISSHEVKDGKWHVTLHHEVTTDDLCATVEVTEADE